MNELDSKDTVRPQDGEIPLAGWTTPMAHGGSQARGQNGAVAATYTTATATKDLSHICDLHHSSWQHQIPDLLSKARDQIRLLMDTSWLRFCHATTGILFFFFFDPSSYLLRCGRNKNYDL